MNKKILFLGLSVLLAAGLAWVGRAVYRVRHHLVTIDVYQTPLATVIKQLERQTRETILAGKELEGKVTLRVQDRPLDEVLDRLGPQVGASWSKWHAVHGSERALNQLTAALRERTKIEAAGWTNLAPQDFPDDPAWPASTGGLAGAPADGPAPGGQREVVVTRGKPMLIRLDRPDIKDGNVEAAVREQLKAAGADELVIAPAGGAVRPTTMDVYVQATGDGRNVMVKAGGPGGSQNRMRIITRSRDGKGQVTEEVWSPEHLVLEQRLLPKLDGRAYPDASEEAAREVSEKVNGTLTTLYMLSRSPVGFPLAGKMMRQRHRESSGDTNAAPGELPPLPDLEGLVRRTEAEIYTRLTPEQRVQRAREKSGAKSTP